MRKQLQATHAAPTLTTSEATWLDLDSTARVEVTSEMVDRPIESALIPGFGGYWQAASPGPQSIRLRFDEPQSIHRIHLEFEVTDYPHTQEFVLRWSDDGGASYREIVRQQYNFSPPGTCKEVEDYRVNLKHVTDLELIITADISGGDAYACLQALRIA